MRSLISTIAILSGLGSILWFVYALNREAWVFQAEQRKARMGK